MAARAIEEAAAAAHPALPPPIQTKMSAWAAKYREEMVFVARAVATVEGQPTTERAVCNELLTATYNAQSELAGAPDPDIEEALAGALSNFAEGGRFCLRRDAGMRDTYVLLGKFGIDLTEKMLLNVTADARRFSLEVQWVDAEGFVVATDHEFGVLLGPYESRTIRGNALIEPEVSQRIAGIRLKD